MSEGLLTGVPPTGVAAPELLERPGAKVARRPLHFVWIVDCSGSMDGEKMGGLNYAVRSALPAMQDIASQNAEAQVLIRVLEFSDGARWKVASPTPVESFEWEDLAAGGVTDMGKALAMLADQLRMPPMDSRALPPVLVLLSDGQPTDDFNTGLRSVLQEPWGKKAVRIAIAVGGDADKATLQKFIDNPELKPLEANNAATLTKYIKWASTAVLKAASSPASQPDQPGKPKSNVPLPPQPAPVTSDAGDVF